MKPELVVVVLLYYEPYAAHVLRTLQRFLTPWGRSAQLVVVCNAAWVPEQLPDGAVRVPGDNHLREFSGWDAGIAAARAQGLLDADPVVLFVNDTFCVHNAFGPAVRASLKAGLEEALRRPGERLLVGEAYGLEGPYAIADLPADRWVSTHAFAMTSRLLRDVAPLCAPASMDMFYTQRGDRLGFSPLVSDNLARHIEAWLLGHGRHRWQGHGRGGPPRQRGVGSMGDLGHLRSKADAILLEKLTTARSLRAGARLIGVGPTRQAPWLRRAETLAHHFLVLTGRKPARVPHG